MHLVPWSSSDANGCGEARWQQGASVGQEAGAGISRRRPTQTPVPSVSGQFLNRQERPVPNPAW